MGAGGLSFNRSKLLSGDLDFENAVLEGVLSFAGTALRRDFSINFEQLRLEGGRTLHVANTQNQAIINLGAHLPEGSTVSFRSGNFHGGRMNFTGLHMDGGRLDLRIATMTRGSVLGWPIAPEWKKILIPEDDQIVSRLRIPTADASDGVVVQTEPFG